MVGGYSTGRARFFRKWRDQPLDAILQTGQDVFVVLKSNPDYAGLPSVWKKSDAPGAQNEWLDPGARFSQRTFQRQDGACRDVAEKFQREVKLFRICPADISQSEWFQLALDDNYFVPGRLGCPRSSRLAPGLRSLKKLMTQFYVPVI